MRNVCQLIKNEIRPIQLVVLIFGLTCILHLNQVCLILIIKSKKYQQTFKRLLFLDILGKSRITTTHKTNQTLFIYFSRKIFRKETW